jgi:predicted small secreted protein
MSMVTPFTSKIMKERNALFLMLLVGASLLSACSDTDGYNDIKPRTAATEGTASTANNSEGKEGSEVDANQRSGRESKRRTKAR